MIRLTGITKHYRMGDEDVRALDGVDVHIARNEYVALIGPSGSGKSTLMNLIGCLDTPTGGRYVLNGRDTSDMDDIELAKVRNLEIGFVFQSFHLLPRLTVLDNVCQPLVYRGIPRAERQRLATHALGQVGLGNRMGHRPNQLSGGQRQRVAVARALVGRPAILLADEPTGNLDSRTSAEIMALFDELHADGQTVVVVTHEPDIAAHCRRTIRLADGRVVEDHANPPRTVAAPPPDAPDPRAPDAQERP
jgi:putative ABC transport system ATP-binding protein